jgi:hypothetical protein
MKPRRRSQRQATVQCGRGTLRPPGELGEGTTASFTLVAAFFSAMDHDVPLARATVGAAASVVAPFAVRVHADTPLIGVQIPNKDAAGPACSSTQPSSTVPCGAAMEAKIAPNANITARDVFLVLIIYSLPPF